MKHTTHTYSTTTETKTKNTRNVTEGLKLNKEHSYTRWLLLLLSLFSSSPSSSPYFFFFFHSFNSFISASFSWKMWSLHELIFHGFIKWRIVGVEKKNGGRESVYACERVSEIQGKKKTLCRFLLCSIITKQVSIYEKHD